MGYYLQGIHHKVSNPAIHLWEVTNYGSSFYFIHMIVSFAVINTKASWTINKLSSCTEQFIIFYASFIINRIRSVIHKNFDMEEDKFNFSIHISPYLRKYGFFAFLWSFVEGVSLPGRAYSPCS